MMAHRTLASRVQPHLIQDLLGPAAVASSRRVLRESYGAGEERAGRHCM